MKSEPYYKRKIILALFLSGLSGFIDILGLFGIGGMFLSFMSGNSTRFAFYLADGRWRHALPYLLIISGFVLGAFIGDLVKSRFPKYKLISILSVETALILTSYTMLHFTFPGEWTHFPLTVAMGLQNAIQIEVGDKIVGRTFFSGVLHSLGASFSQFLQKKTSWKSPALDLLIWIVAVSGAFLAGILQPNIPTKTLLGAVSIILLLLIFFIIILRSAEKRNFITLR